jgi:hypothetical protein
MSCADSNTTGLAVEVSIATPNTPYLITVSGSGTTRTVQLQVDHTGFWLFKLWLVDSDSDPRSPTLVPPSGGATVEWFKVTDSTGLLEMTITHEGTRDWYLAAVLIGPVATSSVISFP